MVKKRKLLVVDGAQFGYLSDYFYFTKYLKNSFEIDYICIYTGKSEIEEIGVNVIYIRNRNKIIRNLHFIIQSVLLSWTESYDTIFVGYSRLIFIVGFFSKPRLKILDIRTGDLNTSYVKRKFENYLILFTSFFFNRVSVISLALAKLIKLNLKKTHIIPLGADVLDNSPKFYNKMHLVYVGSLDLRDIQKTIEGVHLFKKRNEFIPFLHYDIIGFGNPDTEKRILDTISQYNLAGVVQFHGRKTHTELKEYFSTATIGVCFIPCTPFYEVQPATKLFEYAFSGLITIATDTSENKKVITDDNGVICQDNALCFCEALEKVYMSLNSYNEIKIRGSLASFSWERITNDMLVPLLLS